MKLIWLLLHNLGESRGFAFVEFSSIDEAREWIEAEQVGKQTNNQSIKWCRYQTNSKVIKIARLIH